MSAGCVTIYCVPGYVSTGMFGWVQGGGLPLDQDARALLDELQRGLKVEVAFLALFKFIEESPNGRFGWLPLGERAVRGVECDRQIAEWHERLRHSLNLDEAITWCADVTSLERVLSEVAAGAEISPQISKSLVIALRVLDASFRGVHPGEVGVLADGKGFARLRAQIRQGEPLFQAHGLSVYPRPRRLLLPESRGQGRLTDLLDNLAVVAQCAQLRVVNRLAFSTGASTPQGFSRVGIIPTIHAHRELSWTREANERYSVREHPESTGIIHERVAKALRLLMDAGADLVLMPELVAGPELNQLLSGELARRTHERLPNPLLILSGTLLVNEGERTRNRAHLYDREGELLWCQDKLHAYRFSVREQEDAGHPLGAEDLVDRIEAIDVEPRTLYVVDMSPTQRLVVLTCEDFIQPDPHRAAITDIVATTILVPIMSGNRASADSGWIQDAALNFVRHPGATSIVANSGALLQGGQEVGWQFGHLVSSPRLEVQWRPLGAEGTEAPIAWLAELPRMV